MPHEGMSRSEYRQRKWGSAKAVLEMDRRLTAVGREEGIPFALDLIQKTPNTFEAHRLAWLADREGVQEAFVDGLFRAYFIQGRDIGDPQELAGVAAAAGLDRERVDRFLKTEEGAREIRAEEAEARQAGVDSVPYFILGGKLAVVGAQTPEVFLEAFDELAKGAR